MIQISNFSGELPRIHPRLLSENSAQLSLNTKLERGTITPVRRVKLEHLFNSNTMTIYKHHDGTWYGWDKVVDVAPAPVAEDRIYYTGDGVPKLIAGGQTWPLAVLPPIAKLSSALVSGEPDPDLESTVLYTYTFVTSLGEESEPAPLSDSLLWSSGLTVRLSGFQKPPTNTRITTQRIYRSQTSASGVTTLYFITERDISTSDFIDDPLVNPINEPLPSNDYNAPPDGLEGLIALTNGMMAAFTGKTLFFCEPYQPHAWPEKYTLTTDYEIVGLCRMGSAVAVLTNGQPYVVQGSAPENMIMDTIRVNYPCVTRRSIVDLGYSCAYASTDGLVVVSSANASIVSNGMFTADQWRNLQPHTIIAGQFASRYMFSHSIISNDGIEEQELLIADLSGETSFIQRSSGSADALYFQIGTGKLYLLRNNREVYEWDAIDQPFSEYTWLSKRFVLSTATSFGYILVEGEDGRSPAQIKQQQIDNVRKRTRNRVRINENDTRGAVADSHIGAVTFAGCLLESLEESNERFSCSVYGDGNLIGTVYRMNQIKTLPGRRMYRQWEIEVRGNQQITGITLAYSPTEIAES